jgi:hypothetical protein
MQTRLSINYSTSLYEAGRLQPESSENHLRSLEKILKHIYALATIVKAIHEDRLDLPTDADVLDSFGELWPCITDDAFSHLDELGRERKALQENLTETSAELDRLTASLKALTDKADPKNKN